MLYLTAFHIVVWCKQLNEMDLRDFAITYSSELRDGMHLDMVSVLLLLPCAIFLSLLLSLGFKGLR